MAKKKSIIPSRTHTILDKQICSQKDLLGRTIRSIFCTDYLALHFTDDTWCVYRWYAWLEDREFVLVDKPPSWAILIRAGIIDGNEYDEQAKREYNTYLELKAKFEKYV